MDKRRKILEAQERLEKTLTSPSLMNAKSIQSLVENQLLRTQFSGTEDEFRHLVKKRAVEVFDFLVMLRSASGEDKAAPKSHGSLRNEWKLKQQTDQLRVMYREGPEGTPFHTLLCEGFVDGPVDCCLCVSWESTLYNTWWPQYTIPTFKIISSSSLQKVRIGEEISIVRIKVPWPLSEREALLHYFEVELFDEDLVIVLINTIPDTEDIDASTHGFTKDGIPAPNDTVRIDLVGGFVLQKLSSNISYFRAIANMDIKLDFMPPWLINFTARQLIGNGHKLYTKAVAAVAAGEKDYRVALRQPMYSRIRETLYSSKPEITRHEHDDTMIERTSPKNNVTSHMLGNEIEEEYKEPGSPSTGLDLVTNDGDCFTRMPHSREGDAVISPEVGHALQVLDEAIVMLRLLRTSGEMEKLPDGHIKTKSLVAARDGSLEIAHYGGNMNDIAEGGPIVKDHREQELATSQAGIDIEHGTGDQQRSLNLTLSEEFAKANLVKTQVPVERMSKVHDEVTAGDHGAPRKGHSRRKKLVFCGLGFY